MKILAIFKVLEGADMERIRALLLEEERFAWRAVLDGWLREHYESDMPDAAISILELESIEAARDRLQSLPLLAAGLITVELYPLRPFRNWEVLFREEEKLLD
ncbi:MAG: superoxide dismutase [Cyanobacteria bacterium J06639_1]